VALCRATKRSGAPCTVSVGAGQAYCHHHDPARSEERRRAASRAGKSKPSRELFGIKAQLEKLTEKVLSGEIATGVAAVANQIINTRLRAVELERKIKETEELEERMEVLEQAAEGHDGWRA
jgi:cell division protein FtsL